MMVERMAFRKTLARMILAATFGLMAAPSASFANDGLKGHEGMSNETPKELQDIGIDEHLGSSLDLGLTFRNENGEKIALSSLVNGSKPVLLTLAYYGCPSLCNYHLNGLNDTFKQMKATVGHEFEFVVVSIEPKEKPELAKQKRAAYVEAYGRPESLESWHFLTGDEASIRKLAEQVGFKYRWDENQKQWAHAAAAYVLTPEGRISRYFYGIVFDPKVVRLSLIEASNGAIGTIVDKLTLFCFHFNPKENKYTVAAFNIMRAGGGLMVLIIAAFLAPFWIRSRNGRRVRGEA